MNMWKHVRENESLCETLGEYLGWWEFIYVYLDYLILFESNDELLSICLHNYDYVKYVWGYECILWYTRVWGSVWEYEWVYQLSLSFVNMSEQKKIREIITE